MNNEIRKFNEYGKKLEQSLKLRYNPQAVKLIENISDVPADAIYPMRDLGKHIALCQALAMSKRDGKTVFMQKEDHWCWNPLISLGHVECKPGMDSFEEVAKYIGIADPEAAKKFFAEFPTLPLNKYVGILCAPLQTAEFVPDVVLINSNNAQLRAMIWGIKNKTGKLLESAFDVIDSCTWSIVVPMNERKYRITIPDPGDYERAMADEDEIILSVPCEKMEELMGGLEEILGTGMMGYTALSRAMDLDYARPPFYNTLFEMWGLDTGKAWKYPEQEAKK